MADRKKELEQSKKAGEAIAANVPTTETKSTATNTNTNTGINRDDLYSYDTYEEARSKYGTGVGSNISFMSKKDWEKGKADWQKKQTTDVKNAKNGDSLPAQQVSANGGKPNQSDIDYASMSEEELVDLRNRTKDPKAQAEINRRNSDGKVHSWTQADKDLDAKRKAEAEAKAKADEEAKNKNGNTGNNGNGDGKQNPKPNTEKAMNELFSVKGIDGNPIVKVGEDGSLQLTKPMSKAEFMNATGSGKSNLIKGLLTGLSGVLMAFGVPTPNLGKAYEQMSGNNVDEVYNQYLDQINQLQSTFTKSVGEAYGDTVKNKAKQVNTISDVEDPAYWDAYRAKGMTDNEIKLQYDREKAEIDQKYAAMMAKLQSDLSTESQKELAAFVNGLELEKKKAFIEYYSNLDPETARDAGRAMANFEESWSTDEKNQKLHENIRDDAAAAVDGTAKIIDAIMPSDRNVKSFAMPKMFH